MYRWSSHLTSCFLFSPALPTETSCHRYTWVLVCSTPAFCSSSFYVSFSISRFSSVTRNELIKVICSQTVGLPSPNLVDLNSFDLLEYLEKPCINPNNSYFSMFYVAPFLYRVHKNDCREHRQLCATTCEKIAQSVLHCFCFPVTGIMLVC